MARSMTPSGNALRASGPQMMTRHCQKQPDYPTILHALGIGHLPPLGMGRLSRVLGEDRLQQGYDRWALLGLHASQRIAHPMHAAALMGSMEDLRGGHP